MIDKTLRASRSLLSAGIAFAALTGTALAEGANTLVYGYVNGYVEKVNDSPALGDDGKTVWENNPHEFDVPNINLMIQSTYDTHYKLFLNLKAPGADGVGVSTAWVEAPIYKQYLKVRAGKIYRRFGLYNEILDAVPTYIGIEPPELFDGDHLMLTRTTNLMLHGSVDLDNLSIQYSLTTGNDEKADNQIPIGADLKVIYDSSLTVGTSFYTSNGWATPSKGVGEGSPDGGVLPWMERDKFSLYGGYLEYTDFGVTLQVESWVSPHEGERNAEAMGAIAESAGINKRQAKNFGVTPGSTDTSNVKKKAKYEVKTTYVRLGYSLDVMDIEVTPYVQYDIYENPETIQNKKFGGDNEAGLSDDGKFSKSTLGVVVRPNDAVAFKVDASTHNQKFNDEDTAYSEIRGSFSYFWHL